MQDLEQMQREQLALFKEGEKIATQQRIIGISSLKEVAEDIMLVLNWEIGSMSVEKVIKVYQGFLDNGGQIDFTKG